MRTFQISPGEVDALREALDDEYKAWATYAQVLKDFGPVRPFSNIIESEARHITALVRILERFRVPIPENPWPSRVPRYATLNEACEAGVEAEIENERLYQRLLATTRHPEIRAVFQRLRQASQNRHLPAFLRCAGRHSSRR